MATIAGFLLALAFYQSNSFASAIRTELPLGKTLIYLSFDYTIASSLRQYGLPVSYQQQSTSVFFPRKFVSDALQSIQGNLTSQGYALGFLAKPSSTGTTTTYSFYVAICWCKMPANSSIQAKDIKYDLFQGANDASTTRSLNLSYITTGSAVPVWNANPANPLTSINDTVVSVTDNGRLQLTDFNKSVVWNTSGSSKYIELLDSGNVMLYNAENNTVWQSFEHPSDTLLLNQKLTERMMLVSENLNYTLVMMPGGISFSWISSAGYLPYWQIPIFGTNTSTVGIASSSCGADSDLPYAILTNHSSSGDLFELYPGSCKSSSNHSALLPGHFYDFVKLENDGWLHFENFSEVAVDQNIGSNNVSLIFGDLIPVGLESPDETWGMCDLPLSCHSFGICLKDSCICPQFDGFSVITSEDGSFEGCNTPRLSCDDEPSYQLLQGYTSIFLLSGATFDNKTSNIEDCKQSCSSSCSCPGFFYVVNTSLCFPIPTEGVTFVNVSMRYDVNEIRNYATYLKISTNSSGNGSSHISTTVIVLVSVLSVIVAAVIFYLILVSRNHYIRHHKNNDEVELKILPPLLRRFSYKDLMIATHGFSRNLGAGAFGSVYFGTLPHGSEIAVKELSVTENTSVKQFVAEISAISPISHVNIVNLLGFCWESSHRLLVYEYMENGSLDKWIFNSSAVEHHHIRSPLSWERRYNIALGIARGLTYLHEECNQPILHLDIKPQNILLGSRFEAKLSDFGLSKLMARDASRVLTTVRGTPGYMAPEMFLSESGMSKKCDVYSMGMVFLELIGGRKSIDIALLMQEVGDLNPSTALGNGAGQWHFPSWAARKCEVGKLLDLVDKRLAGEFEEDEARTLILVAMWCLQENPSMRPAAKTVVNWLEWSSPLPMAPPFTSISRAYAIS